MFVGGDVGRPMVQYAEDVSKESVIDVRGKVVETPSPVSGCTQKEVELKIEEVMSLKGDREHASKSGDCRSMTRFRVVVYTTRTSFERCVCLFHVGVCSRQQKIRTSVPFLYTRFR